MDPLPSAEASKLGRRLAQLPIASSTVIDKYFAAKERFGDDACDLQYGNPNDGPHMGYVEAMLKAVPPTGTDHYAYKLNEKASRKVLTKALLQRHGVPFEEEDIYLVNGAFAGILLSLNVLVDPGDEVLYVKPPWFFYETMIVQTGGIPVGVSCDPGTLVLDLETLLCAVTEKTKAIIFNNPHNPTGELYGPEFLTKLSEALLKITRERGSPVYLISDEAYSDILHDGATFSATAAFYPYTFMIYTYSKVLLSPGQRIAYLALPPTMPGRDAFQKVMLHSQISLGWCFPAALLQHTLGDLEELRSQFQVEKYTKRRDIFDKCLTSLGYQVKKNVKGCFYMMFRVPTASGNDWEFCDALAEEGVLCLPGTTLEMPGWVRVSLTASDSMLERSLPVFERVMQQFKVKELSQG
ncbi:unnamed protein product [Chrysoparadoxa australica]